MKIRTLAFPLAAALLAVACTKRPVQPEFTSVVVDTLLTNGSNTYEVSYDFASIANVAKSPVLEAIQQANIGYFFELEEFSGNAVDAIRTSLSQFAEEIRPQPNTPAEWGPLRYETSVSTEATVVDTLLTYRISQWSFTGGAHGSYGDFYHTYSLVTGHELVLADLFTPLQIETLNALIRKKLMENYNATDDAGLEAQGFTPDYIAANDNFCIAPEGGITFYYNPYEIGCYALGAVEVAVTREELEAL